MKQCIICDTPLLNQQEMYKNNHYLCGNNCTILYIQCLDFNKFKIDINVLNEIRKETIGINTLTGHDVDERIDK
jgi:hypothetical protein